MFYEIRRYQTQSGRRDEWVRFMEDVVIPYQRSKGMTIVGSFVDEQDADGYVWIRRFEDEQDRITRYTDTYEDPQWTDEIRPTVAQLLLLDHTVVTRVHPTSASPMQ